MQLTFLTGDFSPNSRKKFKVLTIFVKTLDFLRENRLRYTHLPEFYHVRPLGSPYNAIKILTLTPNIFEILGENFGGCGPAAPGGRRVGVTPNLRCLPLGDLPPYKTKLFVDRWRNALRHSGRRKKVKFLKMYV